MLFTLDSQVSNPFFRGSWNTPSFNLDGPQVLLGWDPSDFEKLSEAPGRIQISLPTLWASPPCPSRLLSACSPMTTCGNWSIDGPVRPTSLREHRREIGIDSVCRSFCHAAWKFFEYFNKDRKIQGQFKVHLLSTNLPTINQIDNNCVN